MVASNTVFVVDDDEAVNDSLGALLKSTGFAVETFRSGLEFLEFIGEEHKGCLLLDVRMPNVDGFEVQRRLAANHNPLPVIIMTGHADVPIAVKAMKAGALDFLEKPFSEEALLTAVTRALDKSKETDSKERAAAAINQSIAQLTAREREVFDRLVTGETNKVIAHELEISPRTVEIHRARVMEKLEALSITDLVRISVTSQSSQYYS